MSNQKKLSTKHIPKYDELVSMDETKSRQNDFQVLLNHEPPDNWIKTNKYANNSRYLSIDKVEYLLTRLFVKWWVEVKDYKVIANSVCVHVRLFYIDPITNEMLFQDGLGASPMQTDEGAGATDFNKIKASAVQISLPAAETYAIKDAAEKIGRIFGKDLNRKDLIAYENLAGRFEQKNEAEIKRIILMIDKATSRNDLEKIKHFIKPEIQAAFDSKLATLTK